MADHVLSTGMCFVYIFTPCFGAALATLFFYFVQGGLTDRFEYEVGPMYSSPRTVVMRNRRATLASGRNLRKGSVYEIPKEQEKHTLQIGIKWDVPDDSQADIDVTCTKFNKDGRLQEAVYFAYSGGNLSSREKNRKDSIVQHMGDNLTGSGRGLFHSLMPKKDDKDNERIEIRQLARLRELEPSSQYLFFTLHVFSARDTFAKLKHLRIRIMDATDSTEICRFDKEEMPDSGSNAFILGVLYHKGGNWLFEVIDEVKSIKKPSYEHGTYRDLQPELEAIVKAIEASELELVQP
jgi:stress response protein SCP2